MLEKTNPQFLVGPTKFGSIGEVRVGRYMDGMLALKLIDPKTGEPILVATVCMYPAQYASKKHVWIKNWSENEGILTALENANVVEATGDTIPAGYVEAYEAELTSKFIDALPDNVKEYIK